MLRFLPLLLLVLTGCADLGRAKAAREAGDYGSARAHFEDLAERGFPQAQAALANMSLRGEGATADPTRAVALYRAAFAEQKTPELKAALARACREAGRVEADDAQSLALFAEAHVLGDPEALLALGDTRAAKADSTGAKEAYLRALAEKDTRAYARLSALTRETDRPAALAWLYRGRDAGAEDLAPKIASLEKRLTPEQLARALRMAAEGEE
jgi:TPR repeat protein